MLTTFAFFLWMMVEIGVATGEPPRVVIHGREFVGLVGGTMNVERCVNGIYYCQGPTTSLQGAHRISSAEMDGVKQCESCAKVMCAECSTVADACVACHYGKEEVSEMTFNVSVLVFFFVCVSHGPDTKVPFFPFAGT